MYQVTRFTTAALLITMTLTGCSDTLLTDISEMSVETEPRLERAEPILQPSAIEGEISGFWVTDVGDRSQPERKIDVETSFKVVQDASGHVEGRFDYKDTAGTRFAADIRQLRLLDAHTATFAGPLTLNAARNPKWVYVRVQDGGSPGADQDRMTYQIGASPSDEPRSLPNEAGQNLIIERGNISVR